MADCNLTLNFQDPRELAAIADLMREAGLSHDEAVRELDHSLFLRSWEAKPDDRA